jgi:hypothetical protein
MIYQDFWLTQDGTIEQSSSEHAKYARRVMLKLDEFYPMPKPFDAITKAEARDAAARGIPKKVIAFLEKGGDPRKWALKEYGWVRTAQNNINLWQLNEETLGLLRDWVREFNMDITETFDLEELSTGEEITVNARQLRNAGTTPAALKAYGQGIGRYRNPNSDDDGNAQLTSKARQFDALIAQFQLEQGRDPEGEEIEILKSRLDPVEAAYDDALAKLARAIRAEPAQDEASADEASVYEGQQMFQFAPDKEDYLDLAQKRWINIDEAIQFFMHDHAIDSDTSGYDDAVTVLQRTIEKHWGFSAFKRLGKGSFATAFYTPAQTVLKLTLDWDDVRACAIVKHSPAENLVRVHASGVSQVNIHWHEGAEGGYAVSEPRIGLIETAYVPFDFHDAFDGSYAYTVANNLGYLVSDVKDKHRVWPNNILNMKRQNAILTLRDAQAKFIKGLKRLVSNAPLEVQGQLEDVLRGVQQLAERGIYTVDVHASNARWDGSRLIIIDFGVGKLRWDVSKRRTKVFRPNPPESDENNVVLIDSDIQPDELDF